MLVARRFPSHAVIPARQDDARATGSTLARRRASATAILLVVLFLAALSIRVEVLWSVHTEGDELLYAALVEQLEAGRGYTLRGHPLLLERPSLDQQQYDRPLFYHPPGGIGLFWGLSRVFGSHGMGLAQLVSFAVFYWSAVGLGRTVLAEWNPLTAAAVAGLAGFTPIVAHVHTHWWLDGPQVAFVTAGAALLAAATRRAGGRGVTLAAAAGAMLGWACLTKMNAILVLPFVLALAWSLDPAVRAARLAGQAAVAAGVVALSLAPWLVVQWSHYGELMPSWAGKPDPHLVATNGFVWFVTAVRGPWSYVRLLPQAMCTIVVATLALPWLLRSSRTRRPTAVLVAWVASMVLVNVWLGYLGYSKLLRYAILLVPAAIVWFGLAVEAALAAFARGGRSRPVAAAFLVAAALALAFESLLGVAYSTVYRDYALILLYPDLEMMQRGG
jgi:4-amino-4-deoxy-L-arabinose transferase-like glycosyltransferase